MENEDLKQNKRFFIIDWLISLQVASANHEKLFLYTFIGALIAVVYILSMLVIKQYIQRRNMYRKLNKPDIHEYDEAPNKKNVSDKPPQTPINKTSQNNSTKSSGNKIRTTRASSIVSLNQAKQQNPSTTKTPDPKAVPPTILKASSSRISKSSNNINNDGHNGPNNGPNGHNNNKSNYEKLNNNFNPNFVNNNMTNSFTNHSHANLYNYNNGHNQQDLDQFDNFEGFKLITRNGSTKIVNGQNDDISEYEIPIIRYNDRSMQQQYLN